MKEAPNTSDKKTSSSKEIATTETYLYIFWISMGEFRLDLKKNNNYWLDMKTELHEKIARAWQPNVVTVQTTCIPSKRKVAKFFVERKEKR